MPTGLRHNNFHRVKDSNGNTVLVPIVYLDYLFGNDCKVRKPRVKKIEVPQVADRLKILRARRIRRRMNRRMRYWETEKGRDRSIGTLNDTALRIEHGHVAEWTRLSHRMGWNH